MKISDCRALSPFRTLPGCRAFRHSEKKYWYSGTPISYPPYSTIHAIPYFLIGIICGPIWGSFPVRDHLRSNLGIICGPGSFAVPTASVVSIQFVDGAKGMLLRFLRITENKLMSMRQIRIRKNQILKNIQSLSTERVLHDPAELFVHLCVSTYDGKR